MLLFPPPPQKAPNELNNFKLKMFYFIFFINDE